MNTCPLSGLFIFCVYKLIYLFTELLINSAAEAFYLLLSDGNCQTVLSQGSTGSGVLVPAMAEPLKQDARNAAEAVED